MTKITIKLNLNDALRVILNTMLQAKNLHIL